ncbi:MAG: lamin tail domain-containing protein [Candidatus Bathyarchaeota archaeon]|nr:lamin tail domain-containing protein [Candidatus Bathyarchaeum sp.]
MVHTKNSALPSSLFALLLIATLLFGVVHCSSNTDTADLWSADSFSEVDAYASSTNQKDNSSVLFINEFMADNGITIASPDGNSPDWIEVYNAGAETINMSGMYLTDNLADPTCWQFPEDTYIGSGEYMIIWADTNGGDNYATFSLNANGEEIGLFASDGVTLIDSVVFTKQLQDVSYGRIPDGSSTWDYLSQSTPGSANQDPTGDAKTSVWAVSILIILVFVVAFSVVFIGRISTRMRNQ